MAPSLTTATPAAPRRLLLIRSRLMGAALLAAWLLAAPAAWAGQGTVEGQVKRAGKPVAGQTVVLLRLKLNAQGQPEPAGKPDMATTDAKGRFKFTGVEIDKQTVYQLGTRADGQLQGSRPFGFPEGANVAEIDLDISGGSGQQAGKPPFWIQRVVLVVEPLSGGAVITEVVHLFNNTGKPLSGAASKLALPVQKGALELAFLEGMDPTAVRIGHGVVEVSQDLPPGPTMMAYRYRVEAPFGSFSFNRQYPLAVDDISVFTPKGEIQIAGAGLVFKGTQNDGKVSFSGWNRESVPAGAQVEATVSGLPPKMWVFIFPAIGLALGLGGLLAWFVLRRIKQNQPQTA